MCLDVIRRGVARRSVGRLGVCDDPQDGELVGDCGEETVAVWVYLFSALVSYYGMLTGATLRTSNILTPSSSHVLLIMRSSSLASASSFASASEFVVEAYCSASSAAFLAYSEPQSVSLE